MTVTMTMNGERFVVLPESTFDRLIERLGDVKLPELPEANERGRRPARETGRTILARKLIKRRVTAGWTQEELAARADFSWPIPGAISLFRICIGPNQRQYTIRNVGKRLE